jgi:hypothetical protein
MGMILSKDKIELANRYWKRAENVQSDTLKRKHGGSDQQRKVLRVEKRDIRDAMLGNS